ncbi:hypothetical protein Gpo141_00001791 [Globisporangium polare]
MTEEATAMAVSRSLVAAKFAAQLCSTCFSSFVGLHHARGMLRPSSGPSSTGAASTTSTSTSRAAHASLLTPSQLLQQQQQRRTQRASTHTAGTNSATSASDLANSRHLLQQSQGLTSSQPRDTRHTQRTRRRRSSHQQPKAAASTRILRAACFADMAFSMAGAVVTGVQLFAPAHAKSFQLLFWAQAPHWGAQIASFLWMATLGLYIAKQGNRAAFDVAIAHAVIWLLVVFYWVLEVYAMYYDKDALLLAAQIIWKALAMLCFIIVGASWALFARRWKLQGRRKGAMVLSKILSYAIAFFLFVSPSVIVDLVQGLDNPSNNNTVICSTVLALWPTANAIIYLTKQTLCLRFFQKLQLAAAAGDDLYSLQSRHNNQSNHRRMGANGQAAGGLAQQVLMSPNSHELKGLVIGEKIGEGIAVVYSGKWRGANVAVKMKALLIDSTENLAEFQHACNLEIQEEAEVMKGLCHPNIVLFMEAGFYKGSICIVSEYCARGSLRDVLMRSNVKHLSWPTKLRLALGICHGIQYLHNAHPPMIHRDLKSPNVLVDDSWHAKIADFGTLRFAEIVSSVQNSSGMKKDNAMDMTGLVGTTRWMAPEVIRGEKSYSSKVDIYSLALILWELIEGKLPFESTRWNHEIEDFVLQGMRPLIKEELCPMRWKLLIVTCWQSDPAKRPTIQQVINNLQRIAREEVWDTTAPRFTGVSSQFSATQSSYSSQASFVSSTVSASYMDSPPSILGGSSLLQSSSLVSSSLILGGTLGSTANSSKPTRKNQWSRLSDTLEEHSTQQFVSDSDSSSMDEYNSSITILEPPTDEDSFLDTPQQYRKLGGGWSSQRGFNATAGSMTSVELDERQMELSMSDLEIGGFSNDSELSHISIAESSPNGSFVVTI